MNLKSKKFVFSAFVATVSVATMSFLLYFMGMEEIIIPFIIISAGALFRNLSDFKGVIPVI